LSASRAQSSIRLNYVASFDRAGEEHDEFESRSQQAEISEVSSAKIYHWFNSFAKLK
jgi:hypothetical protein